MAYKKKGDFEQLETVDLERDGEGTVTEFKLLSAKSIESKTFPGKMNNVYTVDIDGEKRQFWGSPILDRKLGECEFGHMVKVVYLGKIAHKQKGFNPMKNFDVFEDDGSEGEDESLAAAPATGAKKKTPF